MFVLKAATEAKPYHYVGAGLPNVYLVGVTYRYWPEGETQSADIPALPALLDALAKALLEKRGLLNGDELRFLRKQLKVASKDFAPLVGVSVEQYSRLENGATVTPTVDRLVRLLYAAMMKLTPDLAEGVARATWTAKLNHEERIVASQDEHQRWVVKTKAA
ncbi:MAG TPA: helix-turn-helix domain-containing protein [Acidobacteriaceae bacterium]|nr:helix-turn-helix domain-containing protein [Acidobacteriaceae bacterium]